MYSEFCVEIPSDSSGQLFALDPKRKEVSNQA